MNGVCVCVCVNYFILLLFIFFHFFMDPADFDEKIAPCTTQLF